MVTYNPHQNKCQLVTAQMNGNKHPGPSFTTPQKHPGWGDNLFFVTLWTCLFYQALCFKENKHTTTVGY